MSTIEKFVEGVNTQVYSTGFFDLLIIYFLYVAAICNGKILFFIFVKAFFDNIC